jgi:hypothetical protein
MTHNLDTEMILPLWNLALLLPLLGDDWRDVIAFAQGVSVNLHIACSAIREIDTECHAVIPSVASPPAGRHVAELYFLHFLYV